jgi:hypothetical protein
VLRISFIRAKAQTHNTSYVRLRFACLCVAVTNTPAVWHSLCQLLRTCDHVQVGMRMNCITSLYNQQVLSLPPPMSLESRRANQRL